MHQRRIEKGLLHGLYCPIKPFSDGLYSHLQSFRIGSECVEQVAVDIAGKLVEEDEEGEGALWGLSPTIKG